MVGRLQSPPQVRAVVWPRWKCRWRTRRLRRQRTGPPGQLFAMELSWRPNPSSTGNSGRSTAALCLLRAIMRPIEAFSAWGLGIQARKTPDKARMECNRLLFIIHGARSQNKAQMNSIYRADIRRLGFVSGKHVGGKPLSGDAGKESQPRPWPSAGTTGSHGAACVPGAMAGQVVADGNWSAGRSRSASTASEETDNQREIRLGLISLARPAAFNEEVETRPLLRGWQRPTMGALDVADRGTSVL